MQAGVHVDAGLPAAGFPLIDEALALVGTDTLLSPLLHVVRGDLSQIGPDGSAGAATESYERAYGVSAKLGAPMTQLRAAVQLARIAPEADRERRVKVLRAVHATFTEGFETPDLVEAAELLAT
jgi:hypothetical protein